MAVLTAQEAARVISQETREFNGGNKLMPKIPDLIKRVSEEHKLYIFNVGPWPHTRGLGSLGSRYIPACEEGQEYSRPLIVPGIVTEEYPPTEKLLQDDGQWIAEQILGEGRHLDPSQSFRRYGVFISHTEKPSKADLQAAREQLEGHYRDLVAKADAAYAQGPKATEETISADHYLAARKLNLGPAQCGWIKNATNAASRANCEGCGATYEVGVILCRSCGFILDPVKYAKNKERFAKN